MNILLTGASGFIGQRLGFTIESLSEFHLTSVVRSEGGLVAGEMILISQIDRNTDWRSALIDQDLVIHAAARAHIMKEEVLDPLREYRDANVDSTLNLAHQAAEAGVKRFIFISSIGVNGNVNAQPFTEDDTPNPLGFYAQTKWEAEQGLWEVQSETGMELVIIRPPLVYGPNAPGNFGSLLRWVNNSIPMPLGAIHNKRSLVALDNLVDLIITCIDHPAAANQVFLAGDGEDLSTTELLRGAAQVAGVSSLLIPVPASVLMFMASLVGKKEMAQQLLGSLQIDISKARDLLDWTPILSVEEGLRRCFVRNEKRYRNPPTR